MQPSRIAPVLLLFLGAGCSVAWADDSSSSSSLFKIDGGKTSDIQGKTFSFKDAQGFGGTAPGFDKTAKFGDQSFGWSDRRANIGGRDVYAPWVDMNKPYAVPQTSLFQGDSAFSGKTSPLADKTSGLPLNAQVAHFDTTLFEGKEYQGREEDLVRQAMGRLDQKSTAALAKQIAPQGSKAAPTLSIDDVKSLINRDVTPQGTPPPGNVH